MSGAPGLMRNLLLVYLDPELFTEEEAEENLQEIGVDTGQIREKGEQFIKKLEAKKALKDSVKKREEFEEILEQFKKEVSEPKPNNVIGNYRIAARKGGNTKNNAEDETDDEELLRYIRRKK